MDTREQLNQETNCCNLIVDGEARYCRYLTNKIGRLYPVNKPTCNIICQAIGPHNGRVMEKPLERMFIKRMWSRHFVSRSLAKKIVVNYSLPVDIYVPPEYSIIKDALSWLNKYSEFKGIMLTGSIIVKSSARPQKDYDIVLWFSGPNQVLQNKVMALLPKKINGVTADYFVCIGEQVPNFYFVGFDVDNKVLYTSSWFDLKIKSVPADIQVVNQTYEHLDEVLKEFLTDDDKKEVHSKIQCKACGSGGENHIVPKVFS